ncbi:unnamed protein product [Trichogramma brassicae]|uniref:FYVE-type domain-containing protein n=1 Tax=Trichogramma brassicae TaxID=86971 RepID=A0A6H5ICG2_9HYME|nr:unnamed protein product [Trichogramma brassicae]
MAESEPMEGFICPICMTDFKTPVLLTKHFEEYHKDDPEILRSLKGHIRSHTKYFKEIRNTRLERFTTENNKLLIRLDKLLNQLPTDPIERKAYEQAIVPWMDDKDARLCLTCAKSFNLTRRKHHCRLCGVMMCHGCSLFLSLEKALSVTQDDSALSPTTENKSFTNRFVRTGIGLTKLVRSPSSGSLNTVLSMMSDSNAEQFFRVCQHCMNLLDSQERLKARHFEKPIVYQYYEKMQSQIKDANKLLDTYHKMWQSLNEGESTYRLVDAQMVRGKIAKIGDNIDVISKRIATLVTISDDSSAMLKQEYRLNQMVRSSAMLFLKNNLLRAPPVPTEEEYEKIKRDRQDRIKAQIAYERQLEQQQLEKQREIQRERHQDRSIIKSPTTPTNQSQGWGTSNRPTGNMMISSTSIDPFVEQMSNLKFYIKQAREECKFEEVATLEKNLKELQSAYFAMQQNDNNSQE